MDMDIKSLYDIEKEKRKKNILEELNIVEISKFNSIDPNVGEIWL